MCIQVFLHCGAPGHDTRPTCVVNPDTGLLAYNPWVSAPGLLVCSADHERHPDYERRPCPWHRGCCALRWHVKCAAGENCPSKKKQQQQGGGGGDADGNHNDATNAIPFHQVITMEDCQTRNWSKVEHEDATFAGTDPAIYAVRSQFFDTAHQLWKAGEALRFAKAKHRYMRTTQQASHSSIGTGTPTPTVQNFGPASATAAAHDESHDDDELRLLTVRRDVLAVSVRQLTVSWFEMALERKLEPPDFASGPRGGDQPQFSSVGMGRFMTFLGTDDAHVAPDSDLGRGRLPRVVITAPRNDPAPGNSSLNNTIGGPRRQPTQQQRGTGGRDQPATAQLVPPPLHIRRNNRPGTLKIPAVDGALGAAVGLRGDRGQQHRREREPSRSVVPPSLPSLSLRPGSDDPIRAFEWQLEDMLSSSRARGAGRNSGLRRPDSPTLG